MKGVLIGEDKYDSTSVPAPEGLREALLDVSVREKTALEKVKVGLPREYLSEKMDPEIVAAWDSVAGVLSDAGCDVKVVRQTRDDGHDIIKNVRSKL